jgi:hypothetical protein
MSAQRRMLSVGCGLGGAVQHLGGGGDRGFDVE